MQYMLLIYDEDKTWAGMSPDERTKMTAEYLQLSADLKKSGHFIAAGALQRSHTATTIRVRDGKTTSTDGPFAETREVLGGYFLVEAPNLDEATKIAARIPSGRFGSIEIRPIKFVPDMSAS
jgi:hypothetical protein